MADFPSKVTTETGPPNSQSSQWGGNSLRGLTANITSMMDLSFIRSIAAILMIAEIVLGLLQWALIASAYYTFLPAYGWVMFVAVTLWILTTILFFMILFGAQRKLTSVPWPLTVGRRGGGKGKWNGRKVMAYNGGATVLYLTAFLANAASVQPFHTIYHFSYGHMAAAAFFGALVTAAYGASAFFSYLDWRGDGGNAATSTVPT